MSAPEVPTSPLEQLHVSANLTDEGAPLCLIQASGGDCLLVGQMDPLGVRQMALAWLATAEEADRDAYVYEILKSKANLGEALARQIIEDLEADKAST